jgi:hypothetical protein
MSAPYGRIHADSRLATAVEARPLQTDPRQRIQALTSLIGNTPLLEIEYSFRGRRRVLHAKAEHMNMTGSIKDRMAFHILEQGYERGMLRCELPFAEYKLACRVTEAARAADRAPD